MWNQTLGCQLPSETSLLLCAPGRVDYIYTVRKTWTPWSSQLTHVQLTQGLSRKGKCCYLSSRDPGQFLALTGHAQTTPVTRGGPQTTCMEHNFPTSTTEGEGVDEQECIPCGSEGPLPCQIQHLSMASALGTPWLSLWKVPPHWGLLPSHPHSPQLTGGLPGWLLSFCPPSTAAKPPRLGSRLQLSHLPQEGLILPHGCNHHLPGREHHLLPTSHPTACRRVTLTVKPSPYAIHNPGQTYYSHPRPLMQPLSPILLVVLSLLFYFCFHDTHSQVGFNLWESTASWTSLAPHSQFLKPAGGKNPLILATRSSPYSWFLLCYPAWHPGFPRGPDCLP